MRPFCLLSIEIQVIICHLFHFTFHFAFTQPLGPLCFQVRLPILGFAFNSNFTSGAAPLLGSELCSNQYVKKHKDKKKQKGRKWDQMTKGIGCNLGLFAEMTNHCVLGNREFAFKSKIWLFETKVPKVWQNRGWSYPLLLVGRFSIRCRELI